MNLTKYFHDFKSKRILIVGDAIIDTYLWGEIHRMSPKAPVPVVDVSGAGDTVVSVAAMCLACNINFEELAILSNIAGGIVCEKVGVVPITNKELLDRAKKLLDV